MSEENPLLKKIQLPGTRFRLPSRGIFYTDGELDESVVDGEIEIFSMTTVDEIALRSPEMLFNGQAIERVFKRCIPDIKKPLKLLSKDVDFILACLRVVSYGNVYTLRTRCPECEDVQQKINQAKYEEFLEEVEGKAADQNVPIELALQDEKVQTRIKAITGKRSDEQTYSIDLNGIVVNKTTEIDKDEMVKYSFDLSNGQRVHMKPMDMESTVATYQFQNDQNDLNLEEVEDFLAFIISCTVQKVDDITDEEMIQEWAKAMPLQLKREMREAQEKLSMWGTDFDYTVVCQADNCDHERNISTLLNPITFFMTPSE